MQARTTYGNTFFVRLSDDNYKWLNVMMKQHGYTTKRCRTEFVNEFLNTLRTKRKITNRKKA